MNKIPLKGTQLNENKNRPKGKTTKIKGTIRVYYLTKGLKLLKEKIGKQN